MNPTLKALRSTYKPELAIIVYAADEGEVKYYLESHSISSTGQMLEGSPLKAETISRMVKVFEDQQAEESMLGGWIPDFVLFYRPHKGGSYTLAWYHPAEQRTLWFKEHLHITSGPAMVPPLLYVATGKKLSVFAMNAKRRPNDKTIYYRAPFHNVYPHDGNVCLGSAKAKSPGTTFEDVIRYWEEMFWNSEFSHLNGASPLKEGENLNLIWQEQVASPERPFPMNVLQELEKATLQNLIANVKQ